MFELYQHEPSLLDDQILDEQDVDRLRRELAVGADDKQLILIGKDGGIKLRAPLSTDLREAFALIDSMPMRRAEMREKRAAGQPVTSP